MTDRFLTTFRLAITGFCEQVVVHVSTVKHPPRYRHHLLQDMPTTTTTTTADLRNTLLAALRTLPGTRDFFLHVLVSSPRKHTGLFPYAHPRPRVYLQDILVLLSERPTRDAPRQLVSALEVSVYNIPATSCGILYVSKVDSTGQGMHPSPTATLVKAFLSYYADPATRPIHVDTLWIQLFARAQNQYLFPNSSEHPGKKPLSDVKLCVWWKRVFGDVATGLRGHDAKTKLYYVIPGYSELEAINSFNTAAAMSTTTTPSAEWTYGHQYSQTEIPLPCPPAKGAHNLGHYIPSFEDDPKSRFVDEIACLTEEDGVRSPERKRPKASKKPESTSEKPRSKAGNARKEERPSGELTKVSQDEFWERMSFRQECVSGAMTGFFALGVTSSTSAPAISRQDSTSSALTNSETTASTDPRSEATPSPTDDPQPAVSTSHTESSSAPSPLAPQPGQVAPNLVRRVVASLLNGHEFSTVERAARATETLEGAIRGLCEGIESAPPVPIKPGASSAPLLFPRGQRERTPEPTPARARLEVPRTPPPRRGGKELPDVSPNPFPEPVASLDTYKSHIFGSVSVANPGLAPKAALGGAGAGDGVAAPAQAVTVLAVRKKRKVAS